MTWRGLAECVLWSAVGIFCVWGWASFMQRIADACLCRKGAINPQCPRHGWDHS